MLYRTAETCSFLYDYNKVLCLELSFYC